MDFIQHPTNNGVLGAPKGWDQQQLPVGALPVTQCQENGVPCTLSFWRPTAGGLELLNAGQPVVLQIVGPYHPPVSLAVEGLS